MTPWEKIGPLLLDRDGVLWLDQGERYRRLGPIADVSGDLGPDLLGHAAALLDLWEDAFDDRAEQGWDWRIAKGL